MPLFSHQKQELIDAVNDELPRNLACSGIEIELTTDHGVPIEMVRIDIKPLGKKPEGFSQRERVRRCVAEALLAIGGSDFHGILYEDRHEDDTIIRFVHRAFL
jgi:hypothetical protein